MTHAKTVCLRAPGPLTNWGADHTVVVPRRNVSPQEGDPLLKRILVLVALAGTLAFVGVPSAAADHLWCTSTTIGSYSYTDCSGSGTSISGTTTTIGSYSYSEFSGRSDGGRISGSGTTSTLGSYGYSDYSGSYNSSPWNATGTSTSIGSSTYTDWSIRSGSSSSQRSCTSTRIGSYSYDSC